MAVLVQDLFNGTAGTDISAHAPDIDVVGGGWSDNGANLVELDGSGALKFSQSEDACWIAVGTADQIVTTSFNNGGTDNRSGVLLRSTTGDPTTGTNYYFNFKPDTGTGTAAIFKRISGVLTSIGSANLSLSNGVTYELECSVIGNALTFKVDGVTELSITDTSITTGNNAALQHSRWTTSNARFYGFLVEDTSGTTLTITGATPNYSYSAISGTIDLTPEITVTGATPNYTYAAIAGTIDLTPEITVTGATPNYTYSAISGTVQTVGIINVTGATPNYAYTAISGDITLQGTITVTGDTPNYNYTALRGVIQFGENVYTNSFVGFAPDIAAFNGVVKSSSFNGIITYTSDFSGIVKTTTFLGVKQ